MRRIEEATLKAIKNKTDFKQGNTKVCYQSYDGFEFSFIYLHGNHIATRLHHTNEYIVIKGTIQRWPTRTTCSRLNALGIKCCIRKGELVLL